MINLLKVFHQRRSKTLYKVLNAYYTRDSSYLIIDAARGRKISDNSRQILHGFIVNTFIPFLKKNKIKKFTQIKPVVINNFQNYLLFDKKLLPQSINRQISGVKAIFNHLYMTGIIKSNIMRDISPLRAKNAMIRGCYSMEDLQGVFKTQWDDKKSYLLCALIYTTGLRNSELQNLKVKDTFQRDDIHFLNISRSKTDAGVRIVPLHSKVLETIEEWVKNKNLLPEDYLFVKNYGKRIFKAAKKANILMGSFLGKTPEDLEAENISFYSGRHFYKTMLNSYNLGDIEELFMGHKVNRNISERYNHKNKRGQKELLKKAKEAIAIIDTTLFQ